MANSSKAVKHKVEFGTQYTKTYWKCGNEVIPIQNHQYSVPSFMENAAMAFEVANDLNLSHTIIKQEILNFKGLPHRMEFCDKKHGILYYNDSYATRPQATLGALDTFIKDDIGLILGGSNKQVDFSNFNSIFKNQTQFKGCCSDW